MKKKSNKHVTLHDVAKDAGVSIATVSLVVRGSTAISEITSRKVLESIKRLGYVYNRIAANLRSNKSSTIGIVINDINNPITPKIIVGVQKEFDSCGYTLLQSNSFYSIPNQRRILEAMLEQRIAGLIIAPVSGTSQEDFAAFLQNNIPVVLLAHKVPNLNLDYVGGDFKQGAKLAVHHLVENGHTRIALLGGINDLSAYQERLAGYNEELAYHKLPLDPSIIINCMPTQDDAYTAIDMLIRHPDPPTAVVCFNDLVAIGAALKFESLGINPGKDIALVGFDNIEETNTPHPTLTTISTSIPIWGEEAARLLHRRILGSGGRPVEIILPPELIVRQSSIMKRNEKK